MKAPFRQKIVSIENESSSLIEKDPEVAPKTSIKRRRLTAKYKLRILEEADACKEHGEEAKLLRREGLYSSSLRKWRRARAAGVLGALAPHKRGVKAAPINPLAGRVSKLERENAGLVERLKRAEAVIGVQKKIAELFGAEDLVLSNEMSSCK